jgi:phage terminase small subunit
VAGSGAAHVIYNAMRMPIQISFAKHSAHRFGWLAPTAHDVQQRVVPVVTALEARTVGSERCSAWDFQCHSHAKLVDDAPHAASRCGWLAPTAHHVWQRAVMVVTALEVCTGGSECCC